MGKVAVVYKSKYGTTKQYAQWIAEDTSADLFEEGSVKVTDLADYDVIVFGGCIHAGGIQGLSFLKKNITAFDGKKIIAFAVGLNVDSFENQKQCMEINFVKKLAGIPCYFMRGGFDPTTASVIDKKLMGMIKNIVAKKEPSEMTQDDKDLIEAIENGKDFSDRKYTEEIVGIINQSLNHCQ